MPSTSEQYQNLKNGLFDWVDLNTPVDYTVIWNHPAAPRPAFPYITLQPSTFVRISYQDAGYWEGGTEMSWYTQYEFTLFIKAFGKQSFPTLLGLQTSLNKQSVQTLLKDHGIAYLTQEALLDESALINTSQEERAGLDIRFATSFQISDNVNIIETVKGEFTVNPDSSDPVVINYEIDEE